MTIKPQYRPHPETITGSARRTYFDTSYAAPDPPNLEKPQLKSHRGPKPPDTEWYAMTKHVSLEKASLVPSIPVLLDPPLSPSISLKNRPGPETHRESKHFMLRYAPMQLPLNPNAGTYDDTP